MNDGFVKFEERESGVTGRGKHEDIRQEENTGGEKIMSKHNKRA